MKEASRPDPADVPTVVPGPEDADTALPSAVSSRPAAVDAKDGESLEHDGPRYDRRALLGRGGMGEVFLCADQRIGRSVAMKQIRAGVDQDPAARRRFLREARVQGQLEHPAIVPVYEVAHGEDGRTYFTMKRVKGESLHEWIARVRGDDEAASESRRRLLNAFAQVCLAVDFAHERGVLHRDLKPANIMLGDFGEVYVLDWGLAKIEDAPELDDLTLPSSGDDSETRAGAMLGTPGYIAPEQMRNEAVRQSDVYALGAVLFELLTLERLNGLGEPANIVATALDGVDARIRTRFPQSRVPPELEAICVRATALEPDDRFPTARALHDALTAFLDGDRDLALRRSASQAQAERAQSLAEKALGGDDDARAAALQAVGQALGLDPENRDAISTMVQLFESPPDDLPPEAAAEVDALHQEQMRSAARDGALGYISWVLYVPLLLMMGIRDAFSLGVSTVLMVLAAAVSLWVARRDRYLRSYSLIVMILGTLALSSMVRLFGPYVLLPTILMGQAVSFSLSPYRRERLLAAAMSALGVLGPVVLESIGWMPMQSWFSNGAMVVLPGITDLTPTLTPITLTVASMALIITPVLLIGRARDAWNETQKKNAVQAWHLRQLVARRNDDD
ncbi:MAG: serine/threonine-protein kinase [Myxococcota bacterium]